MTYNIIFKRSIRQAKRMHFAKLFHKYQNNKNLEYDKYNSELVCKKKKINTKGFKEEEQIITNEVEISVTPFLLT